MFERNVIGSAAFGRHMGRVGDRHREDSAQTIMTHPVSACKFGCFEDQDIIRATGETRHLLYIDLRGRWRS